MSLQLSLSSAFVLAGFLAGCSAPATSADEADLATQRLASLPGTADVTTERKTEVVGKCTVEYDALSVRVSDDGISETLTSALFIDVPAYLEGFQADCSEQGFTLYISQPVTFDSRGVLTITRSYSWYYEGAAHPESHVEPLGYDLSTGTPIDLLVSVDAAGLAILEAQCTRYLDDVGLLGSSFCPGAVHGDEYGPPSFAIEAGGIRIHPVGLPHAAGKLMWEGTLIAWPLLAGHLTSARLEAVAAP